MCTIFPVAAAAQPYTDLPAVSPEMLEAGYWIEKMDDPDRILMSYGEIQAFNRAMEQHRAEGVYNLAEYPEQIDGSELEEWMKFESGDYALYLAGEQKIVDRAVLDAAIINMNIKAVSESNTSAYAVATRRCDMKAIPFAPVVSDEPGDLEYDDLQYSVLLPGEPVVVLHESADRQWCFVQTSNCRGWVEDRFLAIANRTSWDAYLNSRNRAFILVTADKAELCDNPYDSDLSGLELPMGTILPLAAKMTVPKLVDGQNPSGNWVVNMPQRDRNGQLESKLVLVPASADVTDEYLPYTSANVITQAFKTLGDRYGWGGMLNERDCSSFVKDVYACFGFSLPRNTSGQSAVEAGASLNLAGYSESYRGLLLKRLRPGAALYFPGHTMFYLGEENGRHYVISALGSYANFDQQGEMELQRVHGTVVNDLSLTRRNGNTWMEELTIAQQYARMHFADLEGRSEQAAIEALADDFIISGKTDSEFEPDATLTRAELAQLLLQALRLEPAAEAAQFLDTQSHWSRGAVGAIVKAGIMAGSDTASFMPDKPVSRAELAATVVKCPSVKWPEYDPVLAAAACSDAADISDWARTGVYQCLSSGVLKVKADGNFGPLDWSSRAEAALAVSAILDKSKIEVEE